jgi:calcineurin-like phosphoesterase family protein
MNTYFIADTHFNHGNIATYCQRPEDFTWRIVRNCKQILKPEDVTIHLGDVFIGNKQDWFHIRENLPGRWILVRGNHDRKHSCAWWMEHGFDFACDGMRFRNCWLTHEPDTSRASGCDLNIHGHLHNIWHGFNPHDPMAPELGPSSKDTKRLKNDWQRLFAIEYTNYMPVEFDKFVSHPDKYFARGIK